MKAKRLPSGAWNCIVFSHFEIRDGKKKRVYKSFTVKDKSKKGKAECERQAAEFAAMRNAEKDSSGLLVYDAIRMYIDSKKNVLSPSTLRSYLSMMQTAYNDIGVIPLQAISKADLQIWVNRTAEKNAPKTVRNKYNLLISALAMFSVNLSASLPAAKQAKLHTPSTDEIQRLLAHIARNPKSAELEIAVRLAAFCGLRLGEICAVESSDIQGNLLAVNKAREPHPDGYYVTKQPKTMAGYRTVMITDRIEELIKGLSGRIVKAEPDVISKRFARAMRYTFHGSVTFRFHDLRHYYASATHAIGVPDEYIMRYMGHRTDYVMKRVYRSTLSDEEEKQAEKIADFFQKLETAK